MFEGILPEKTAALLDQLSPIIAREKFYLAGGSGLALQIGHRFSEDLDFFKETSFQPRRLLAQLGEAAEEVEELLLEKDTLIAILNDVRLSFFKYEIPLLFPPLFFKGVKLADWRDIAAEKFKTLAQRGSKKDFYDIYAIIHSQRLSIGEAVQWMKNRFESTGLNFYHILRSLTYFEDAEQEPEPRITSAGYSWAEVKAFFMQNVKEFEKEILSSSLS